MPATIDHERRQGHGRWFSITTDRFQGDELDNDVDVGDGPSPSRGRNDPP
jgi:hypothetical protein